MNINLVEAAKGLFTPDVVNKASTYLGESNTGISKAIGGIVPAIFSGLIDKGSTTSGAAEVLQMAKQQQSGGVMDNIGSLLTGGSSSNLLSGLLGNKLGNITNILSGFSGLKSNSISSLLGMATPMILSFLGKHFSSNNLDAGGVSYLLSSQRQHVASALPPGLNVSSLTGAGTTMHSTTTTTTRDYVEPASSGRSWLWPLIILLLLGAAALYFFRNGCNKTDEAVVTTDTTAVRSTVEPEPTIALQPSAGTIDSSGNFIYNLGNMVTIDLPNGVGKLEVGENSTEAKLVRFLQSSEQIDTAKGNWFDFTNVRFNTGSATITDESMVQLRNMVLITKAFPTAKFKVGGYTDNVGDETKNVKLSKNRAAAVAAKLKSLGAAAGSIVSSDGYGSQFAIADNTTPEGRAQNRRVSVNVKSR